MCNFEDAYAAMPILKLQDIDENTRLGVWQMEEDESFFASRLYVDELPDNYGSFSPGRRLEYFASRYLLNYLFEEKPMRVCKDANGKPGIDGHTGRISISHSKDLATVIVSNKHDLGIDIEVIHHKVKKVMHKFLNEREQSFFEPEPDIEKLILCWSAKESLYKVYGKGELSFRENILLENPVISARGNFTGYLIKGNFEKRFEINFEKVSNSYLTYVLA